MLLIALCVSYASEQEHVDALLAKSLESFEYQRFQRSCQEADSAYVIAKKIGSSEGIVQTTLYKSKVLIEIGLYKDALRIMDDIDN